MSTAAGRAAEDTAAAYLHAQGFTVLQQNWRTRWCEIDIVATHGSIVYFVEVKYRRNTAWGSGFDYITPRKLRQMQFAARFWQATYRVDNYRLGAIELTGDPPGVTNWLPSLD